MRLSGKPLGKLHDPIAAVATVGDQNCSWISDVTAVFRQVDCRAARPVTVRAVGARRLQSTRAGVSFISGELLARDPSLQS